MLQIVVAADCSMSPKTLAFLASQIFHSIMRATEFHMEEGRLLGSGKDHMSANVLAFGVMPRRLQIAADAGQRKNRCERSSTGAWHLGQSCDVMICLCIKLALVLSLSR
jgi:hypothetical protein